MPGKTYPEAVRSSRVLWAKLPLATLPSSWSNVPSSRCPRKPVTFSNKKMSGCSERRTDIVMNSSLFLRSVLLLNALAPE